MWIDTGTTADEAFVKLFVPLPEGWQSEAVLESADRTARQTRDAVMSLLREMPEFAQAELVETGSIGVRDGGRVRGEYQLTVDDVRQGRRFEDAACRGSWPIEYWHPREGIQLEALPPGTIYEIPLRAMKPLGWENLWTAGKCLSADRYAQSSARVVGTCWAMGEAAGNAAADSNIRILTRESG